MKTEEKYKIFAKTYVMNGFNGKKAAITAGYSEKSAEVTASKLLRNAKVLEIIDAEMKMLSKRMRDDASRIYFELWNQVRMIDDKMINHEEASKQLSVTEARVVVMKADITNLKSKIRRKEAKINKIDGRTNKGRAEKNGLKKELKEMYLELEESKESLDDLDSSMATSRRDLLWHRDWKELLTLRTQILQDLFDRAGYKEMRELQERRLRLLDSQINKLESEVNKDSKNSGTTTIIMSNVDEMQAYLDKKAGGTDERDDTQTTN
ncbi:terminase small subunit [Listeria monocytogenes]|uniref:Terminase n=1 Tax=Listeria monocytogenes serotype 1/2b TaxID=2291966 RepID=A0A4B9HXA2_LISMN|nr:terminase small subunit [Listeria monocytogenes]EAE3706992.1 terminase [Listeria monocytogenes serotype 1/2b]EAC2977331.1 terminase [Listeria monocytogenes]EAC8173226.1 terminase [Listeria monocytogenes]EAD9677949.1 terminase [Listeria monocytogenes]EAD9681175.1 terminase [Listeria monocytogenes]